MGVLLSNSAEGGTDGGENGFRLIDIPEAACVACVFMYLTPPEICNLTPPEVISKNA